MKRRIRERWENYRREVMPADAGAVQVEETERAFYAGARALLSTIMRALDPGTEPTEDDLRMMDEIEAELSEFAACVRGAS